VQLAFSGRGVAFWLGNAPPCCQARCIDTFIRPYSLNSSHAIMGSQACVVRKHGARACSRPPCSSRPPAARPGISPPPDRASPHAAALPSGAAVVAYAARLRAAAPQMASADAQDVILSRAGSVLGRNSILKDDHFPGCQNTRLTPLVEGAPNFRQVDGLPVYGVAIPTVSGLRNVLDAVGGTSRRVLWHSMREEPLVYVNGQPFVLREAERPFSNLELTGITRERVEQMESRLREDVLAESKRYGGRVLVSRELAGGQVVDSWEQVTSVQTPLEVYSMLSSEGYELSYVRIPITDEKVRPTSLCTRPALSRLTQAPKSRDCDLIARRCAAADEGTALIFNCQMGRGRTTTAMIIAALVRCRLHPEQQPQLSLTRQTSSSEDERLMLQGDYAVVRSLVRVVEGGKEAKEAADKVRLDCYVASCSLNLRRAADYRLLFAHAKSSRGYSGLPSRVGSRGALPVACSQVSALSCAPHRPMRSAERRRYYAALSI